MTVIAHEIAWCDTFECDGPATEDPDEPGTCNECGQTLERIKVVRADAYQGAVEALTEVARRGYGNRLAAEWVALPAIEALKSMGVDPSTYRGQ